MNYELRNKIWNLFSKHIQGGCTDDMMGMLDTFIENGDLTQEEVQLNEMAIANLFDADWFTCDTCGWTMPMSEMADNDNWQCTDCEEDN